MGRICNGLKPTMMMVTVQISMAGLNVFYKLAANDGMSSRVLVAYCFMFAAATFVPLALYIERKNRPKLTWMVLWQAFLSALFGGSIAKTLYVQSIALTSATVVSAIINLTSAVTFVMALFFGLERLSLGTMAGKAKIVGTLLSIGGAMLLTFYKGIEINMWSIHVDLFHESQYHDRHVESSHRKSIDQILGPLVALASCLSYSFSLMIQAKINKRYPCYYSSTALLSVMGALQTIVFALCTERDWSQWKLGWNIRLLTVVYSGTIGSGLMVTFAMLCLSMRGPLFVSAFTPLMLVLVAIAGSLLLNEKLHLGSVLGSVIIVCGLYAVLWGKSKEIENIAQLMPLKCPRETEEIDVVVASRIENNKSSNITGIAPNFPPKIDNYDALDCVEEEQGEEEEGVFNINVKV